MKKYKIYTSLIAIEDNRIMNQVSDATFEILNENSDEKMTLNSRHYHISGSSEELVTKILINAIALVASLDQDDGKTNENRVEELRNKFLNN